MFPLTRSDCEALRMNGCSLGVGEPRNETLPPGEMMRLSAASVQVDRIDVHRVFIVLVRPALHLDPFAGVRDYLVLVSDFEDLPLIVNQNNFSAFLGAVLITCCAA